MKIPIFDDQQLFSQINKTENSFYKQYHAFYSSWFGGITQNPHLMMLPMDDHMVHRGDGVFEGLKAENRAVYLLDAHLERLFISAEKIALSSHLTKEQMKDIILQTLAVANQANAFIRIYYSRGPGNFSVNPYDSIGAQFYVVITELKTPANEKYIKGVSIGASHVPSKSWMAQIKSCNYLQNVLMKKEAVDRKLDFVVSAHDGFISEGYTENIMILDKAGHLVRPPLDSILEGTTMIRTIQLAAKEGIKTVERPISIEELTSAPEVMMTGTSLDVLPVTLFENKKIGDGSPGPITKKLRELLRADVLQGPFRTAF